MSFDTIIPRSSSHQRREISRIKQLPPTSFSPHRQVLASLKSVKTACLTAPVLPKLKRACGGKLPLAAELIQKLRVFSRIPTEEEFESLNDDDLQELQDYRNELRCCLRDLICTSEETAFFVNQCALNIRSASSWQAMEEEFHVLSAIAKNVVGLSVPQISEIIFNIAKDGLKMRSVIWANRLLASTFLLFCSVYSSVLLEEDGEDDEREVVLDGAAAVPANKLRRGNNANAGIPPNEQGGGSSSSTTVRPSSTFDEEVLTNLVELSLNSLVVHPVRLQNRLEHAANNLDALTAQPNLLVSEFAQTYRASPEYENYRQMNLKLCRWDFRSKQDHTGAVVLQKLCSSANSHLLGQNDRCVEVMAPILFDFVKAALVDSPELCTVEYSSLLLLSEALGALASHSGNVGRWVLDRYFNLGVDYLRAAIQKAGVESSPPEQGSSSTGMGGGAAGSSSAAGPEGSQSALSSRTKSTTESSSPTGENGSFLKKRCRIPAADGGANVTEAIFSHVNLVFRQACLLGDKKHQLRPPKNPATDSVVTTPKSTTTSRSGSVSSNKSITDELDSGHRVRAANFEPYSQQRLEIARQNATNSTNSLTVFVEACTHAVFLASFPKGLEAVDDFLFSVGSSPALCPFVLKLVPQLINHVDYYRVAVDLISLLIQNCQVNAALIFGAGAPGSANSEADRAALSAQVRELTQGVLSRVGQFLLPDLKPKIATLFLHPRDAWGLHSGGFLLARQRTRSSGMLDREQSGVPRPRLEHLDGPRVADLVVAFLECSRNGRSLLNEDSWLLAFVATIFSLVSGGRAENCGGRLSMKLGVDFIACALSDHAVGNLQGGLSISQANPPVAPINPVAVMIENSTLDQLMLPYLTEVLNAGLEFDDGRAGRMLRRRHRHMMHRHERSLAMQEHADLLHLYEDEAHVPIDGFGGGGMLGAMRPGGGGAASANPGGGAGGGAPPVPERLVPPQNTKIASLIVRALLKSIVERGLEQCTEVASLLLLFRNVLVNFRDILIQALDFDGMGRTPKNVREGFCKELLDLAPDAKLNTVKNIIKKLCKNSAPLHTSPGTVGEEGLAADMIRSPDRRPADPEIKKRSRNF